MTPMLKALQAAEQMRRAGSYEEVRMLAIEIFGALGFQALAYVSRRELFEGHQSARTIISVPALWRLRYQQSGYSRHDPVVAELVKRKRAFLWSTRSLMHTTRGPARAVVAEAYHMGFKTGYTLPLWSAGGQLNALSVMSIADEIDETLLDAVHLLGAFLDDAADRFHKDIPVKSIHLSQRERDILNLAAEGKSNSVIADILHSRPHTVGMHMKRIMAKYAVSSRTQAVVRALVDGVIEPQPRY
jgi:DNA-binding CsgD family transcriptional regulator